MMPRLEIPCILLPAVTYAMNHYPVGIPKRYEKITGFLSTYCEQNPTHYTHHDRLQVGGRGHLLSVNVKNEKHVKDLCIHLQESNSVWLEQQDFYRVFSDSTPNIMPIVLIPSAIKCVNCENELRTDSRPSILSVYTTNNGQCAGHSYHKKCISCGLLVYYSYTRKTNGDRVFTELSTELPYFLLSSRTAFSKEFVKLCSVQTEISAITFENISEQYFALHGQRLEAQRVEEMYFLTKLIGVFKDFNLPVAVGSDEHSCRKDLEKLCKQAIQDMVSLMHIAEDHVCTTPGCQEGLVVADGVEKMHRRVCAAPSTTYKLAKDMTRTVSMCPETPSLGNQHNKASKYCSQHSYLDETDDTVCSSKRPKIVLTINVPDKRVSTRITSYSTDLPDNSDTSVHTGCKKAYNVPRFHNRTAGLMAIVKPCGIIVSINELLTCESPSQLFVQLLQLDCDTNTNFQYVAYDRACEFEPFLQNLSKKGNEGAKILLAKKYVVDRFHIAGHTTPSCTLNSPLCKYHPDLEIHKALMGCNTECAEHAFHG